MKRYAIVCLLLTFFSFCLGQSENWTGQQNGLINIDCLHERGFTGKGVTIAHLDDGCDGCNFIDVLSYAREAGYWKGAYDFVLDKDLTYLDLGAHGTATLSIVHGFLPGQYTGTAYDANILMARTENTASETNKEERDWRKAIDWSIANGADIVTSSLQYNNFDEEQVSYTYEDMDGGSTIVTNAADYAASKGLIVVTLQGNFGSDPWYYVSAPGDADSVITVGATNATGEKANFSGFGPSYDGRMKPDIMAMGAHAAVAKADNSIVRGNGTSYAAPAIAGLMACLKQAHPHRTNMQIITAVRQSGDRYRNAEMAAGYGYGVTDACIADDVLSEMDKFLGGKSKWTISETIRYRKQGTRILIKPGNRKNDVEKIVLKDIFEKELEVFIGKGSFSIRDLAKGDYLADVYLVDGSVKTIYFLR